MINFIPLFPLSIVVYPEETLNMHIFEPKYKQLIKETIEHKKSFGVLPVINSKKQEKGISMEILEVTKLYSSGEMDIKTRGKKIFKILEHIEQVPDKLYSGAIVTYPENKLQGRKLLMNNIISLLKVLHDLLKVENPISPIEKELRSYDIAHKIGLTLEQEYELLTFMEELHRQEYLKQHLTRVIPIVAEMEALKAKIKLNGHFKNISGFNIS